MSWNTPSLDSSFATITPSSGSINANNSLYGYRSSNLPSGAFTAWIWYRVRAWTGGDFQPALSMLMGGSNYIQFSTYISNGTLDFYHNGNIDQVLASGSPNTWQFACVTWNGNPANNVIVYTMNDSENALTTYAGQAGTALTNYTLFNYDTGGEQAANVSIRCAGLAGRAYSAAEVLRQARSPIPISATNLNRFYRLHQLSDFGNDISGNNYDLTVSGTGVLDPTQPRFNYTQAKKIFISTNSLGTGNSYSLAGANGIQAMRPGDTIVDCGGPGVTTTTLVSDFSTDILPNYDPTKINIVLLWEGHNSIIDNNVSPSQELDLYQDMADLCHNNNFLILAGSTIQGVEGPPWDARYPLLEDFNDLLRADYTYYDGLIDFGKITQFDPPGNIANPTYYSDGVHLTDLGSLLTSILANKVISQTKITVKF